MRHHIMRPPNSTRKWVILLAALCITACDPRQRNNDAVLVLDLDAVARALGQDQHILEQTQLRSDNANTELLRLAQRLEAEITAERDKLGDEPDAEALAALAQFTSQRQAHYQTQQNAVQQAVEAYRNELIQRFRDEIKPLADAVANRRGARIIMLPQQNLYWYDGRVDITGEVLTAYRRLPAKATDGEPQTVPST